MRPRAGTLVAVALVPLGTIAGHVAGYAAAGRRASLGGAHAHLAPGAWVTALVAAGALAWVAASGRGPVSRPRLAALAGGQAAAFLALEVAELLVAGHAVGHLAGDPAFRWGLAAQLLVAAGLALAALLARVTGERLRALLGGGTRRTRHRGARRRAPAAGWPPLPATVSPASERGPPAAALG